MISPIQPVGGKTRPSAPIYQFKIVLSYSKPPIWRRLQVPGDATFAWLHAVLQVAMGWTNSHLHHFLVGKTRYTDLRTLDDPMGFGSAPDQDETKVKLYQAVPNQPQFRFKYEYDFGDSWMHDLTVERAKSPMSDASQIAVCVDGARACPPEDCGGIHGYYRLQEILQNRKHPEHAQMRDWLGGPLDPEAFDLPHINTFLAKLKFPRATEAQLRKVLMARDGYEE